MTSKKHSARPSLFNLIPPAMDLRFANILSLFVVEDHVAVCRFGHEHLRGPRRAIATRPASRLAPANDNGRVTASGFAARRPSRPSDGEPPAGRTRHLVAAPLPGLLHPLST